MARKSTTKAQWWMLTVPVHLFVPFLPECCKYIRGQLEVGNGTGYKHWQIVLCLVSQQRMSFLQRVFGEEIHYEATKSDAALDYVWKEDTAVENTRFELGSIPFKRSSAVDWEIVRKLAREGQLEDSGIPADIYIRHYSSLKQIKKDHLSASAQERRIHVFWGKTGSGKSHRAWEEAGWNAYPKDPNTKFWDGYQDQTNVVIDEFRGLINISNILRWFDKYPVIVEAKHGATVLKADTIWVTSNLKPEEWYAELDEETRRALLRRLTNIIEFK